MGLSTWALKLDSLDPDPQSKFNVVSWKLHTYGTQTACIALLAWISHTVRRSIACRSDPDPRSRMESPSIKKSNWAVHGFNKKKY